jgi:exopolysaccharide production protein ExoZ
VDSSSKSAPLRTLQVLRGIAVMLVVIHHFSDVMVPFIPAYKVWDNGASGVDLFFVISGFIIPLSIDRRRKGVSAAASFFKRRLERIVPMYWLATTRSVLSMLYFGVPIAVGHTIGSYLFIPTVSRFGDYLPIVSVGWTLTYEMVFYLLIALVILWTGRVIEIVLPIVLLIGLVGITVPPRVPMDLSLFLEFGLGMAAATWYTRSKMRLPTIAAATLLFVALTLLMTAPFYFLRVLQWGFLAFFILISALSLEGVLGDKLPRWTLLLGDASYSIYLVHEYAITILRRVMKAGHISPTVGLILGTLMGLSFGLACYWIIELPILNFFKARRLRLRTAVPIS